MYIKSGKIGLYKTVNALIIAIAGIFAFGNLLFLVFILASDDFGSDDSRVWIAGFILFLMSVKIGIIIWRAILIHRVLKCRIYNSIFEEEHDGVMNIRRSLP